MPDTAAYWRGFVARNIGKAITANPYSVRSPNHADWDEGWHAGAVAQPPRPTSTPLYVPAPSQPPEYQQGEEQLPPPPPGFARGQPLPDYKSKTIWSGVAAVIASTAALVYQGLSEVADMIPWWGLPTAGIVFGVVVIALRYVTNQPVQATVQLPQPVIRGAAIVGLRKRKSEGE